MKVKVEVKVGGKMWGAKVEVKVKVKGRGKGER